MVYLTRIEKFNAAHKLWVQEWSQQKNFEVFGKCANPNFHGHNYTLHVTVKGQPDLVTGFIIDAKKLSLMIKDHVLEFLDHKNLNLDVDFIAQGVLPTTENLTKFIWNQLSSKIEGAELHKILLYETDTIYAEYYGE